MSLPHAVIHEAAVRPLAKTGGRLGLERVDGGDLYRVDGRAGDAVEVATAEKAPGEGVTLVVWEEGGAWRARSAEGEVPVTLRPVAVDIFDRVRGIFETDALRERSVAIIGLGSGGSFIAMELAKAGVGRFVLADHDRLEVGNVCRHSCGLSDLGRLKVHAVREQLLDRNPTARITVVPDKLEGRTVDRLEAAIAACDLIVCATDNRESRLLANRIAIRTGRPILFGAVFRRAYGGQALRVIPRLTPCYQCFVDALPTVMEDQEISSAAAAANIAYSDRPVAIEPGLSSDLLPVALLLVKLAIVELLAGQQTTLASLREDLVAPLFLWVNRREKGTDYAAMPPMENRIDEMTILRWYGVMLERDPACPACGDFEAPLLERAGLADDDLDLDFFGGSAETPDEA